MSKIKSLKARQILDSRGNPTVEVDIVTSSGHKGRASVPSGASTGTREALELRDGDQSYFLGKSVLTAVKNINEKIAPKLMGMDVTEQKLLDTTMLEIDGTENKENLGANAILAVSMAACRAGAECKEMSLFTYLREFLK
ncbi:MAG: enolase, partial [Bacteriovoracaceae bacterium]